MHTESKRHWESVYQARAPELVSWYTPHLVESLAYVRKTKLLKTAAVLDVGGGEATLVDDLLSEGYVNVAVLDISAKALEVTRERLGLRARRVRWVAADVLSHSFEPDSVDIWHDRAVFHFLTDEAARRSYVAQVLKALRPGGFAIVATFGPDGPGRCSGLPVMRYDAQALHGEFGRQFRRLDDRTATHRTPWGSEQQFVYCFCRLDEAQA